MKPSKTQEKLEIAVERAKSFSWQKMAEETVTIYQQSV
jgi:hypothetical protein